MPRLKTKCNICGEEFKNSQTIRSTYCGHIFHKDCLDNLVKAKKMRCPMCLSVFGHPSSHRLFIELDDRQGNSEKVEELATILKGVEESIEHLMSQKEIENNIEKLRVLLTDSQNSKQELQQQIKLMGFDDDFLDLQDKFAETTETISHLKRVIQDISMRKTENLDFKNDEISSKTHSSSGSDVDSSNDCIMKAQNRVLQQKLKYFGEELEKEITNGTLLSIEKMKLESYIKTMKDDESILTTNTVANKNGNDTKQGLCFNSSEINNVLIIENFPIDHMRYPPEKVIINMAAIMELPICYEDICEVRLLNKDEYRHNSNKDYVLFVKFRNEDIKLNFLSKEDVLKKDPLKRSYILKPQVDESILLLLYAKDKLQNNNFVKIYWEKNRVFAENFKLEVLNKGHVDNLLRHHIEDMKILVAKK